MLVSDQSPIEMKGKSGSMQLYKGLRMKNKKKIKSVKDGDQKLSTENLDEINEVAASQEANSNSQNDKTVDGQIV